MALVDVAQVAGVAIVILGALWGIYTGFLPNKIREMIGYYDLKSDVECVKNNTDSLKSDHQETIEQIETIQAGQVAIAEAVAEHHNHVDVDSLREQHFGDEGPRPGDFTRGDD